ncbi:MAG: hypothetical protein IT443_01390 [Phycisphaeraceae bacterium]|nr:hypothetical protein [Phycisphaeraceae bacterium]
MKAFWNALAIVLIVNFLGLCAFGGYLYLTGRLSRDRLHQIVAIVTPTPLEEEAQKLQAQEAARKAKEEKDQAQYQQQVAQGPRTPTEQLAQQNEQEQLEVLRSQRLREDIRALQRQVEMARQLLDEQKNRNAADRKALEEALTREAALRNDQDFQQTVQLYEQLKPKQTKDMFRALIAENKTEQVVAYLAAMSPRKAAGVIKEFKTTEETKTATDLMQMLRGRGVELLPASAATEGTTR